MARSAMTSGTGGKIAEHLSVGVLAQIYPWERVSAVLQQTNRASERVRDLPAEVCEHEHGDHAPFSYPAGREEIIFLHEAASNSSLPARQHF